jgi:predicted nucleotidyltransferase
VYMLSRKLEKIIGYAVRIVEPEWIIHFGSMANHTANVFSDVDLVIVTENDSMKKELVSRIKNFSSELSLKAAVLIYSKSDIERENQNPSSFITAVMKSGKVVYENGLRTGFSQGRFTK